MADLQIELTERETALASQIPFDSSLAGYNAASWRPIADAMEELMSSLEARNAIPEPRKRFFEDPAYCVRGRGFSRREIFKKNVTRGSDIYRDGNFVKYLRYFVFGPDLPVPVMEAFQEKAKSMSGDSIALGDLGRQLTRSHGLNAGEAAEEFYKLALDCGRGADDARVVRDRVKKMR